MAGEAWPGTPVVEEEPVWPGTPVGKRGRNWKPNPARPLYFRDRGMDPSSIHVEDQRPRVFPLTGEAVDGDTLRREGGANLRVYGADAPELAQQGWDRAGNPVPIGRNALAMLDALVTPEAVARDYLGQSYGRPVATVDQDGRDVGQVTIRAGNALAAPEFMERTPELRGGYLEAERLARQNRLGVHGVYAQTPGDFRADPDASPDRETVAQFWDTPTPFAGLRPDIERGYSAILKTGTADQILAYAEANGFTLKPRDVRDYVKKRQAGQPVSTRVTYANAPAPVTNQGDAAPGAFARGIGSGATANFLDEAGAVVDTLGGTEGRENVFNSDRRLADIVANNWRQNEAILGYDALAHPYARFGGELAGGLAIPFGAKAVTAADLAKVGGAYAFASGFGAGDSLPERLIGGAATVPVGVAGGVVAGKALQAALPKLAAGWRWVRGRNGEPVAVPVEGSQGVSGAPVGSGGRPSGFFRS